MTMLLVFVFSWLPLNIINLLEDLELEVRLVMFRDDEPALL